MIRHWATASLVCTGALVILGGILRGFGVSLAEPEALEHSRRIAGMVLGVCVLGVAVVACVRHRGQARVLWPSLAAVLCVGAQGFLGTRPVEPDLRPLMITAHLLITLVLTGLLLHVRLAAAQAVAGPPPLPDAAHRRLQLLAAIACGATAMQIVLGAQVRGQLDLLFLGEPELARGAWLAELGPLPAAHRHVAGLVGMVTATLAALSARLRPRDAGVARAAAVRFALAAIPGRWAGARSLAAPCSGRAGGGAAVATAAIASGVSAARPIAVLSRPVAMRTRLSAVMS